MSKDYGEEFSFTGGVHRCYRGNSGSAWEDDQGLPAGPFQHWASSILLIRCLGSSLFELFLIKGEMNAIPASLGLVWVGLPFFRCWEDIWTNCVQFFLLFSLYHTSQDSRSISILPRLPQEGQTQKKAENKWGILRGFAFQDWSLKAQEEKGWKNSPLPYPRWAFTMFGWAGKIKGKQRAKGSLLPVPWAEPKGLMQLWISLGLQVKNGPNLRTAHLVFWGRSFVYRGM